MTPRPRRTEEQRAAAVVHNAPIVAAIVAAACRVCFYPWTTDGYCQRCGTSSTPASDQRPNYARDRLSGAQGDAP